MMNYNKIIANLRQIWAHLRSKGLALSDFEDAINEAVELVKKKRDGLLIEIPCKVGDTVYEPTEREIINTYKITKIHINQYGKIFEWELIEGYYHTPAIGVVEYDIGYKVFLTKEEAAAKLKELKENG